MSLDSVGGPPPSVGTGSLRNKGHLGFFARVRLHIVRRWGRRLFRDGWTFFTPYLAVYLLGLALDLRNAQVRGCFVLLHILLGSLFLAYALDRLMRRTSSGRRVSYAGPAFWIALGVVFLVPGVYLEFPGDPWEHVRRLNMPDPEAALRNNIFLERLAYFWGWSLLSWVPLPLRRTALDFYGALWEILLSFQFYRFSRRLGFSIAWSRVQVFGVLALFGNGLFSFQRYYALAATPLAYISFLRAAEALLDIAQRRRRSSAWVLAFSLGLMLYNHLQEILLLGVFGMALAVSETYQAASTPARQRRIVGLLIAAWIVALPLGMVVMVDPQRFGLHSPYILPPAPWLSHLGCFRIWSKGLDVMSALGLHGGLAVVLAIVFWRSARLVAVLTLAPIYLLLFPPFALLFARQSHPANAYRILYVLPDSFMIVTAFALMAHSRHQAGRDDTTNRLFLRSSVVLLTVLGLWAAAPGFGKLPFLLYRPPPGLTLRELDRTAEWFAENRKLEKDCVIKSDAATEFALSSLLGRRNAVERVSGLHRLFGAYVYWRPLSPSELASYRAYERLCGYLVKDPRRPHPSRPKMSSWVGAWSGHWPADSVDALRQSSPTLFRDAEALQGLGWTKTVVPPDYWYYEPPR